MIYVDYKDQIRLALALYVVKNRGEKSIDEFVEEMRSHFKANKFGVPCPLLSSPSLQPSLTQTRPEPPVSSLLGLWNDRPFPLSDKRIIELDIFLQEAPSSCLGPDLVCTGSIIGTLVSINQALYIQPVQDSSSSTPSIQPLKSLTLRLVRTLHVLLRLVLALPSSPSELDFAKTKPREIISCLHLILHTTLREVLPQLTPNEVSTVCRFIGREIFSEAAKALSNRMTGNTQTNEEDLSGDHLRAADNVDKIGSDDDGDGKDNGGKETFPLLKLLYALIHIHSSLLDPLIRSLLSSLSSLFPTFPNFLPLSSPPASSHSSSSPSPSFSFNISPRRWSQNKMFEIDLFREMLDLILFAIRSTTDPFPLSPLSLLPPSGNRRRQRRQTRLDDGQSTRTRPRRTGQITRSIRSFSYGSSRYRRVEKQREDYNGEEREKEVEGNVEGEEDSEEDEDEKGRGESIWVDIGRFCRRLHYTTTRSSRTIHDARSDPDSKQTDLERVVLSFLENVWTIEGDRSG